MRKIFLIALVTLPLIAVAGLMFKASSSKDGDAPGLVDGKLAACPDRPNCVSSDATDPGHSVAALTWGNTKMSPEEAWQRAVEAVKSLSDTTVTENTGDYLSAECSSRLFGFIDDLELQLRREDSAIAVRSASRAGHSDLGANRKRVELLREKFGYE